MYLQCGLVSGHGFAIQLLSPFFPPLPCLADSWGDELWSSASLCLFGYLWLVGARRPEEGIFHCSDPDTKIQHKMNQL